MVESLAMVALITAIIVGLPCLLVRPLFVAIADRIAGRKASARELQDLKDRLGSAERELRSLRVQVIELESHQEFASKLLEDLSADREGLAEGSRKGPSESPV